MPRESSRPPGDRRFQIQAAIVMGVFGAVVGFVLTMTSQGFSPYEAIGVIVAAGSATGIITRVLLDVLSSFSASRTDKLDEPSTTPNELPSKESTTAELEIPAQPQPENLPQPAGVSEPTDARDSSTSTWEVS